MGFVSLHFEHGLVCAYARTHPATLATDQSVYQMESDAAKRHYLSDHHRVRSDDRYHRYIHFRNGAGRDSYSSSSRAYVFDCDDYTQHSESKASGAFIQKKQIIR